jgi:molybdopterin/thiamine biosynthesis adenylyltransferase/proteasome lid subunit RPN8/RPN11
MSLYREDIVHGMKGQELRKTSILIIGNDPIAANLRMMFTKAGYSCMTWVLKDVTVTTDQVSSDPMLKLSDVGYSYLHALKARFSQLNTSLESEILVLNYDQAKESDLTRHQIVLASDKCNMTEAIRLGDDAQCIWAQTHRNGFVIRLMVNGFESDLIRQTSPSPMAFEEPTLSMLAASHMMAECQRLQHGTDNQEPRPKAYRFTGLYQYHDHSDTKDICHTDAVAPEIVRDNSGKKLAVIGCGALGSHVAWLLAQQGFERVTLIDFDDTRVYNLSRLALIENSDVGKAKCVALAQRIKERHGFEYICMETETEKLPERVLVSMDLIFSCVDRHTARRYLAGISKICDTPLVQGGFGGELFQITTGSEIEAIFTQADSKRNSCTGLSIEGDPSVPVGATQATVGLTAAVMVEAAKRILNGEDEIKNGFYTWGFPNKYSRLKLPTRVDPKNRSIIQIWIPRDCNMAGLITSMHKVIPDSQLKIEHPFVCDWDCPICGKTIHVQRHLHLLADEDRFHPACLQGNEHMRHMNMPRRWTLLEDRIGLESDKEILSKKVAQSGMKDGSIIPVCLAGLANGYVEIMFTDSSSRLKLTDTVVNAMRKHSMDVHKRTGHEAAGILFGTIYPDNTVCINESISAEVDISSPTYVEMSSAWLAKTLYESNGKKTFCGWWHSHPGFGLTPSGRDRRTFEYFPLDTQFSLIIDHTRINNMIAAYQFREGQVVPTIFEVINGQTYSL